MPRDGSGIYSRPPGTDGVPDTSIESTKYNGNVADVETDLNTPRPIIAGGTGATSAAGARTNLQAEVRGVLVTNYDMQVWESGSFSSNIAATGAPNSTDPFTGTCQIHTDPTFITLQARSMTATPQVPGRQYVRQKLGAAPWSAWKVEGTDEFINTSGDTMNGSLVISKPGPNIVLDTSTPATSSDLYFTRSSLLRWALRMDGTTESGGNTGSDFLIYRGNDAGTVIDAPVQINRATGKTTFSSPVQMNNTLTVTGTGSSVILNKTVSANSNDISGQFNASPRWLMRLGTGTEGGGNTGSDFILYRANDAGTLIDAPLNIARSSGNIGLGVSPGTNPGFGNTTPGVEIRPNGTIFASCSVFSTTLFNLNLDGYITVYQRSGTQVGGVNVTTTATSFVTSSDERLKEDLKTFDAGHVVDDTNVYDFAWKTTGLRSYGVIAQQAADVYPAAVFHNEETDFWGIDYSKYVPVLLQELKALRTRVAELEGKVGVGVQPA